MEIVDPNMDKWPKNKAKNNYTYKLLIRLFSYTFQIDTQCGY